MPFAALIPLITTVVPLLVGQADKAIPGENKGAEKRQWVHDMFNELHPLIAKLEPNWVKPADGSLMLVLDVAIEFALDAADKAAPAAA